MPKLIVLLSLLLAGAAAVLAQDCKVEITYLANEGVVLHSGAQKVLIDGVFRNAMEPYLNHTPETLNQIENATGQFAGTSLILATHFHADHFDADSVASHLKNNPHATFVGSTQTTKPVLKALGVGSSPQVIPADPERRATITVNGIVIDVLNVAHTMRPDVQHRGYIVHIGGEKILHLGDADGREQNIRPQRLAEDGIDVALVPEWYLDRENGTSTLHDLVKAKHIVFIHVPPQDAKEAADLAKKNFNGAIALANPGEKHCY
jgi:L-ascorbate metabolism protein UlaG (beta-lactamase superfamily)